MAVTLRRQLSEDEKQLILKNHGRKCFAAGHPIPDNDVVQFDHIRAFSMGGVTELNNIAPMCEMHNKAKGALPLEDFRVKLRLDDLFSHGDAVTLKDLLAFMKKSHDITGYGETVVVTENGHDHCVRLETRTMAGTFDLYTCPTTGWQYFYATLPVTVLDSDDDEDQKAGLQPRFLLSEKVFELFRHFQRHPVLRPSIGRVSQDRLLLFDGQHKVAALLWNGRREFECKIYLTPDLKLLNDRNILAHDKFSQTRFYASIMVLKLGTEFGSDFERYKNLEDGVTRACSG